MLPFPALTFSNKWDKEKYKDDPLYPKIHQFIVINYRLAH